MRLPLKRQTQTDGLLRYDSEKELVNRFVATVLSPWDLPLPRRPKFWRYRARL